MMGNVRPFTRKNNNGNGDNGPGDLPDSVLVSKEKLDGLLADMARLRRTSEVLLQALVESLSTSITRGVVIDIKERDENMVVSLRPLNESGSRLWVSRHHKDEPAPAPPPGAGIIISPTNKIILPH